MKTYNTIEDILNDHELMAKSLEDIFNFILCSCDVSAELFKSINGFYSEKAQWLKSEYGRRQKEYKDKFISHD